MAEDGPGHETLQDEDFIHSIQDDQDDVMWFKFGGVIIEMMIDSGSEFNIICEST